jgi:hypothetical protein
MRALYYVDHFTFFMNVLFIIRQQLSQSVNQSIAVESSKMLILKVVVIEELW